MDMILLNFGATTILVCQSLNNAQIKSLSVFVYNELKFAFIICLFQIFFAEFMKLACVNGWQLV